MANQKGGFLKFIALIVIAVLALSYFNIDIREVAEKPETQKNIAYVKEVGSKVWNEYLSKPVKYFWNNIFVGLLWAAFKENFEQIKEGKAPVNFAPTDKESKDNADRIADDLKSLEPKPAGQ